MLLRPYQSDALTGVQDVYRSGLRRALLVAPTGSGKSAMTRYMLDRTKKRTLILVHREELLEMTSKALTVPHGIIGGARAPMERVSIGMMQTVSRRLGALPAYDWVISDEAHLAMCPTWRSIIQHYDKAWHLGLSATPCRLDGQGLGLEYERIVYGPSIKELIARGFLVQPRTFAPSTVTPPRKSGAEFSMAEAAHLLDTKSVTGDVIKHFQRLAPGRQAVVFTCNREHAGNVAAEFNAAGISALAVDASMPDRKARIASFEGGKTQVLVNVEILTTGWDYPPVSCEIMLRPTKSLALYLQMGGRVLRIASGKRDAVILDHVGNTFEHGFLDDAREWTLEGRAKQTKAPAVVTCPMCYACHRPGPRCPSCDHVYVSANSRRPVEARDGELEEMTADKVAKAKATDLRDMVRRAFRAETEHACRAELERIRQLMGYAPGWVFMQLQLRRRFRGGSSAARAA